MCVHVYGWMGGQVGGQVKTDLIDEFKELQKAKPCVEDG